MIMFSIGRRGCITSRRMSDVSVCGAMSGLRGRGRVRR